MRVQSCTTSTESIIKIQVPREISQAYELDLKLRTSISRWKAITNIQVSRRKVIKNETGDQGAPQADQAFRERLTDDETVRVAAGIGDPVAVAAGG